MNINQLKPIGEFLIVKLSPVTDKSKSGLIIRETRDMKCEVISIGPGVDSEIKVGQFVLIELGEFQLIEKFYPNLEDYAFVHTKHIIGIFENE